MRLSGLAATLTLRSTVIVIYVLTILQYVASATHNSQPALVESTSETANHGLSNPQEVPSLGKRQDLHSTSTSTMPTTATTTTHLIVPAPTSTPATVILPQNYPNVSMRVFPYTPMTGARNSLYLTPNITSRDGLVEIKVGVLLPYSLPNNLTQQLTFSGTSAIRMAVSEINAKRLIPGAYITLVLKDSFNGWDPDNSGASQAIFSTVSLLQNDGVSGVIGDVSSALTVQSALLTSRLSIPQCSFSAGSTQLSSREDYGSFFRTIPTELMFGRVMMDFVVNRGWKSIAVFYTGDALGSEIMDSIALYANMRDITVGYRRAFWEMGTSSDVGPGLDALKESGHQIVLVAAVGIPQVRLLMEAVRKGLVSKDYVWLTINQVTEPLLEMEGSTVKPKDLNGLFMFDNMLRLHGYRPYEEFLDRWAALNPLEYPYAGERNISSNEAQAYSCMMVLARGFANAVKGNGTALHLLAAGRLRKKLKPLDMNTNYTGPGGPMAFDEIGDVLYGNFILYNYQHGRTVDIGTSYSGVFNVSSPPMYFDGRYATPSDMAPLQILNPTFRSSIGIVIILVAGLGILFSFITMAIVIIHRDAQVIKASSPLFCCLELCGFILLYFSAIMALDIPIPSLCIVRPITLNMGFILVVSNIVAKNFRVYRIFHNIYVTNRVIRDSHLLRIVGIIMTINLVIMAVWFIKTPPTLQQIAMEDLTAYWDCTDQVGESAPFFVVLFVYNIVLLLLATYLAYKNRNVAANYNECRQIAFVVYNILLSGCIAMPTIFLPQEEYLTKFFLTNIVLLFGTTVSLMFLFLPKLHKLFSQINSAKQGSDRSDTGDNSSFDGLFNDKRSWLNVASVNGSGSSRSGSDECKNNTFKESHVGYMGVKLQNRYLPFLASWCMRRVILFPSDKYFTAFESGKPEDGSVFSYRSVSICSREPDRYILKVMGSGRYNFLFQVRDEACLIHWYGLFENKHGNTFKSSAGGSNKVLSMSNLPVNLSQNRSESEQTLQVTYPRDSNLTVNSISNMDVLGDLKKSGDEECYFSRATKGSSSYGLTTTTTTTTTTTGTQFRRQHRHTSSSYTLATIMGSPRSSLHESERPRTRSNTLELPPSQQLAPGISDRYPRGSAYPLDNSRLVRSVSARTMPPRQPRHRQTSVEQGLEEFDERQIRFGR